MVTSDACLMRPTTYMQYWCLMSGSYFLYDFIVCIFLIKDDSPIMKQTYIHHVMCIIGTFGSIAVDNHVLTICMTTFLCELSTPLVNLRAMLVVQ